MMKTNDEIKVLLRNVTVVRQRLGISQRKMAELLKVSVYTISKIERGALPPRLKTDFIFHLADLCHVCPAAVFYPFEEHEK